MATSASVIENKLVASLARPGGNVTGVTLQSEDVLPKLIENLHAVAPLEDALARIVREKAQGITFPRSLLLHADEVIE